MHHAHTGTAIEIPNEKNAASAGAEKHDGKHHEAREFGNGLMVKELPSDEEKGTKPGDRERREEVDESLATGRKRRCRQWGGR